MSRIDSPNPYQLYGPVISIAELAKTKPDLIVQPDDPRVAQFSARMAEIQAVLRAEVPEEFGAHGADRNSGQIYEPAVAPAQPKVTAQARNATVSSLDWELARSRMAFEELLKK